MSTVNKARVVGGGLLAGLVMNIGEAALHGGILGPDAAQLFARYQLVDQASPVALVSLVLMTFVLGMTSVWLYAAISPRYGAGARTAIIAGLAVWMMAHVWAGVCIGMGFMADRRADRVWEVSALVALLEASESKEAA